MTQQRDEHIAAVIEGLRRRYDRGDSDALLQALRLCLAFEVLPPEWVRAQVMNAIMRFWTYEAVTLDEAFGVKRSTDPRTITTERMNVKRIGELTQYIWGEQVKGASLNEEFFAEVGQRFGINKGRAIELWNRGRAAWGITTKRPKMKRPKQK